MDHYQDIDGASSASEPFSSERERHESRTLRRTGVDMKATASGLRRPFHGLSERTGSDLSGASSENGILSRASEDRERIERRPHPLVDPKGRRREHELVAVQAPGRLDGSLEVEIVENVHAKVRQGHLVDRKTNCRREPGR